MLILVLDQLTVQLKERFGDEKVCSMKAVYQSLFQWCIDRGLSKPGIFKNRLWSTIYVMTG